MNERIFRDGLAELSAEPSAEQLRQFMAYSRLLKEWNEKMNLTAVTDDDGISVKHFLDSALPLYHIDFGGCAKIADVGTGAGFPGLPIKLLRPDTELTLIDSLNKRIGFLSAVVAELGLSGVTCVHGRAEDLGKDAAYRESFDAAVSRAVANMTVLCEYCLPFVKVGGMFVALKAADAEEELTAAKPMIGELGGEAESVISAPLPMSDITRTLIVIRKIKPTPARFPRRADKIKKSSLRRTRDEQ